MDRAGIRQLIIDWLDDNHHFGEAEDLITSDDISWIDHGILKSLAFVELILFLEDNCSVDLPRAELTRENFDGMNKILTKLDAAGARLA
jgi:acyl carrier protein